MNKIYKYSDYLYRALQIFIGIDIIYRCKDSITDLLVFFGLFLVIVINDHLRRKYFYKSIKGYYSSILLSMIISLVLEINVDGYIDIYFSMILYELILCTEGKISRFFIGLQIISFMSLIMYRIGSIEDIRTIEFWQDSILDIVMIFMAIFFYVLSLFGYKTLRREKIKVERLNKELALSYSKLKEQSEKIEELTIAKERNRVAREIHDNLGHSLVALNMNLDVAEKIIDKDKIKAKELIIKSQMLTKESMESLRKAVYALKEGSLRTLLDSIKIMVDNIESTGKIKVILNIDERVEELPPKYKDIIYFSIKEALTNSIKHGEADEVDIDFKFEELILSIRDNGLGCSSLVKGNGLLGIEERVCKFGGSVNYSIEGDKGFEIQLILDRVEAKNNG